jgi:exonuclease VII large subunit
MEDQIQTTEGEALNSLKNVFKKQTKQIKTLEHNLKASYENEYTALVDSFNRDKERLINAYTKKSKGKIKSLQTNLQKRMNENSQLFKLRQSYAKKRINNFEIKYDEYVKLTTINMLNFLKTKDSETKEYNEQLNKDLSNAITHAKKYVKLY